MARTIAYRGSKFTIAFAAERSGWCPAAEFFLGLGRSDQAKLMALFMRIADFGPSSNPEKFGDLGGGLFEFKSFQIRMPFAYAEGERGVIVVSHGFMKKRARAPKEEIERAWRILREDRGRAGVGKTRKAGQ